MPTSHLPARAARVAGPLLFAVVYFGLSRLGLSFLSEGHVALLWPASGLALGVFVSVPRQEWSRYVLAAFVANLAAQAWARGVDTPAVGLAAVNALEPLLAAWAMQTVAPVRKRLRFESTREFGGLLAAATIANAVTATLGAAILTTAFTAPFESAWRQWWLADGLGMLAVAPLTMMLRWKRPVGRDLHAIAFISITWLVAAVVCWQPFAGLPEVLQRSRAILPLLLWVAVGCGARAAAIALAGVAAIATSATVAGVGPFVSRTGVADTEALQSSLGVAIVSTLFVASVVAERRRAEAELRTIFESSPAGTAVVDADGAIANANRALAHLAGRTRQRLAALTATDLVPAEDRAALASAITDVCTGVRATVPLQASLLDTTGRRTPVSIEVVALHGDQGRRALLNVLDVSERNRFETELRHLADHDSLTGLMNRRRFETEVDRQLSHGRRYSHAGAVILLDVDRFKQINDTYGHGVGDRLIVSVAAALRSRLRESDAIARLGGDEFAVLLPQVDRVAAEAVARELVVTVAGTTTCVDGHELPRVTASVGVAPFGPHDGFDRKTLVVVADMAMYRVKEAGRNGYAIGDGAPAIAGFA